MALDSRLKHLWIPMAYVLGEEDEPRDVGNVGAPSANDLLQDKHRDIPRD